MQHNRDKSTFHFNDNNNNNPTGISSLLENPPSLALLKKNSVSTNFRIFFWRRRSQQCRDSQSDEIVCRGYSNHSMRSHHISTSSEEECKAFIECEQGYSLQRTEESTSRGVENEAEDRQLGSSRFRHVRIVNWFQGIL